MTDNKILNFQDYVKKYNKISEGLDEQLEAEIISINEVREKKELMNKKLEKLVLDIHPYSIKQMEGKDTRWCTTIKKEGSARKIIKKNTYEEIITNLIDFYSIKEEKKVITLRTMYPVWIEYKKSSIKKTSTIRRIDADWRRFYLEDNIIDFPLEKMTKNQISAWINNKIVHEGITKAQVFYNMLTIFKNIFEYCYSEDLIPSNTFEKAKYRKELLQKNVKPLDSTQVFTRTEIRSIVDLAFDKFTMDTRTTSYLGIALLFQSGLRCGELVTLKASDYDKVNKILHIERSESRSYTQSKDGTYLFNGVIVDTPKKTASFREIKLSKEACRIIDLIISSNVENGQSDGDYLFVYNNHRIQTAAVLKKIYALCDELGIERRSTHKIRKTVLSVALDESMKKDISDISAIRKFAGHVDENTLFKSYTFSTREDEMEELVNTAFNW